MKTKKSTMIDPENPPLTEIQLRNLKPISPARRAIFHRAYVETYGKEPPKMGRPPKGENRNIPISLRVPPTLLAWTKTLSKQRKMGYQTTIIHLLAASKKRAELGQPV